MTYYSPTDPTQQVPVTPSTPSGQQSAEPSGQQSAEPSGPQPTPEPPATPSGGYPTYPATPAAGYPVQPAPAAADHVAPQPAPPTANYPIAAGTPIAPYYPGAAPSTQTTSRANLAGIIVTAAGVLFVLLGVWLPWYAQDSQKVKFSDILRSAKAPGAKSLPHFYFGVGLWLAIGITIALCLLANMGFATSALRIVGPLVSLLGAALVLTSLSVMIDGHGGIFDHAAIGLFLVLLGFVVAAVGGLLGDRPGPRTR